MTASDDEWIVTPNEVYDDDESADMISDWVEGESNINSVVDLLAVKGIPRVEDLTSLDMSDVQKANAAAIKKKALHQESVFSDNEDSDDEHSSTDNETESSTPANSPGNQGGENGARKSFSLLAYEISVRKWLAARGLNSKSIRNYRSSNPVGEQL